LCIFIVKPSVIVLVTHGICVLASELET
jgi:hypothetical protein